MKQTELDQIIKAHKQWLEGSSDGVRADLTDADLRGADLRGVNLTDADLTGADLTGANLRCANLPGANLRCANLTGADLRCVNLTDVNLTGANLTGVNLTDADLRCVNLTDADLTGADLTGANLRCANLRGVNLTGVNLTDVNLTGANLRGAKGLPIASDSQQRLRAVASEVLAFPNSLQMGVWHGDCGTTHCLAGWAIHHAGPIGDVLEKLHGPHMAGLLLLGVDAAEHFYDSNNEAIAWLQSVAQETP